MITGCLSGSDARGKELTFTQKPQRIVCSYVFADEILLDLVSHDRIAGMDRWVHDPELSSAVQEASDVKTVIENNSESIIAVKPDLVLLPSYMKPEMIDSLAGVGEKGRGEELVGVLHKDLEKVKTMKKPGNPEEKALMFMRFGAFGGKGTIYNDVLTELGFRDCYNEVREKTLTGQNLRGILSKEEVVRATRFRITQAKT